jgi:glycine/D-amino acid oxidase-like deaminating enzyme
LDLTSTDPYWPLRNGLIRTYPPLADDADCEILILGAGITGAILAERLTRDGWDVLVLDCREVAHGSTAASTAILQYEIDTHLVDLIDMVGQTAAERAYLLCLRSINTLEDLASKVPFDCGFCRKQSLYLASREDDVPILERECAARRACGINVEFVRGPQLSDRLPVPYPTALISHDAASCDPFRMAHGLLEVAISGGARVHDRTEATKIECTEGGVVVQTDRDVRVTAKKVLFATGYEASERLRKKVVKLKSTYAMVTQPLGEADVWCDDWLVWESARPYLYFRTTADRRLLAGGRDDNFRSPMRRDAKCHRQAGRLLKQLEPLFPSLRLEIEYAWAGTFGETEDGLAYIGPSPDHPNAYFALGYGGNGITFSAIAADILSDLLRNRPNPDAEIFRFGR